MELTTQRLLSDPMFRSLPAAEQLKGLREIDAMFAALPEREQMRALKDPAVKLSMWSPGERKEVVQPETSSAPRAGDGLKKYLHLGRLNLSLPLKGKIGGAVQDRIAESGGVPRKRLSFPELKAQEADALGAMVESLKRPHGDFLIPEVRAAATSVLHELKQEVGQAERQLRELARAAPPSVSMQQRRELIALRRDASKLASAMYPMRSQAAQDLAYQHLMGDPAKTGASLAPVPGTSLPAVPLEWTPQ